MKNNNIVEFKNVSFYYKNSDFKIKNISFFIKKKKNLVIIGNNASGKTTLVKLIYGLILQFKGLIKINNIMLNNKNLFFIRSIIGIIFQNPDIQFIALTVREELYFTLENFGISYIEIKKRIFWFLNLFNMERFIDFNLYKLSFGQKQIISIIKAFCLKPKLIIFDEIISSLDFEIKKKVILNLKLIQKKFDITFIFISHEIDEIFELIDNIFIINNGKIIKKICKNNSEKLINFFIKFKLKLPFYEELKFKLKKKGIFLPLKYMSENEIINYLWKFLLEN